jgi:hypothetical protein
MDTSQREVRTLIAICPAALLPRSRRRMALRRLSGGFLLGRLAGAEPVKFDHRFPRCRLDEEVRQCPNQRIDPVRREPRHLPIEIRCERAHLIFEGRKRTDVKDAPRLLLVERGDRFGADDFAREACTAVNGTLASTMRKVASTISPPLFISVDGSVSL